MYFKSASVNWTAREPFYAQAHATIDTSGSKLEDSFGQLLASLSKTCTEFEQFCDGVGKEAVRKGLTEQKLAEILAE